MNRRIEEKSKKEKSHLFLFFSTRWIRCDNIDDTTAIWRTFFTVVPPSELTS